VLSKKKFKKGPKNKTKPTKAQRSVRYSGEYTTELDLRRVSEGFIIPEQSGVHVGKSTCMADCDQYTQ
jgi:hypothetical protein